MLGHGRVNNNAEGCHFRPVPSCPRPLRFPFPFPFPFAQGLALEFAAILVDSSGRLSLYSVVVALFKVQVCLFLES